MALEMERTKRKRGRPRKSAAPALSVLKDDGVSTSAHSNPAKEKGSGHKAYVVIDHPKDGEKFKPHHYAIRIGGDHDHSVEVAIDGGDWKHCRLTGGYYWYDWHSIPAGKHKIVARIKLPTGEYKKSKITHCEVSD